MRTSISGRLGEERNYFLCSTAFPAAAPAPPPKTAPAATPAAAPTGPPMTAPATPPAAAPTAAPTVIPATSSRRLREPFGLYSALYLSKISIMGAGSVTSDTTKIGRAHV